MSSTMPSALRPSTPELRTQARHLLGLRGVQDKVAGTQGLASTASAQRLNTHAPLSDVGLALPGRPELPQLVEPGRVAQRSPFTLTGRVALLHAIAHIEFNAINLALDACWRFAGMPAAYYLDWIHVAGEEALHFSLLQAHLHDLGAAYGDLPAHDGLWAMAERTSGDVTARMALVPRTLEARGLDATPAIQDKLRRAGDARAVEILDVILRDEIGHVAIGNHWYRWRCEQAQLDPLAHYRVLCRQHRAPRLRPPFNAAARLEAGFTPDEMKALDEAPG